jgi:hypothetical protein
MADGFFLIRDYLIRRAVRPSVAAAVILSLTAACLITMPPVRIHQRIGYGETAAAIPFNSDGRVLLASADERGEGAMVAELLLEDPGRTSVILRGTRVLSSSDWMGRDYTLLQRSPVSVMQFLNSTPVHFVVVDMNGFIADFTRPNHRLLEETIHQYSDQFRLMGFSALLRRSSPRPRRAGLEESDGTGSPSPSNPPQYGQNTGARSGCPAERLP